MLDISDLSDIRGEGQIEKVFVLDAHGFIKQKEVFVERNLLRSWSLETGV